MLKMTGFGLTGLHGRFEVLLVDNRLVIFERPSARERYRSDAIPPKGRDRDELLWRAADAMVGVVVGRNVDPQGHDSGLVHDLCELLLEGPPS